MLRLGIIGAGSRASGMVGTMRAVDSEVSVAVVADVNETGAREKLARAKVPFETTRFVDSPEKLVERAGELDGIVIGTRCDLHTRMGVIASQAELPVFLEKPVAISHEQIAQLGAAYEGREESVVISFPLRVTPLFQKVLEILRSGRLGVINQIQASNYVPYGGVYYGQWYRDYPTTGGLWLQKATHDFDCINYLAGAAPNSVVAMSSRKIYGGTMPEELWCSKCDRVDVCSESPKAHEARGDDGGMGKGDHACAFSESVKHQDAGSALIMYENGVHASYAQNFIARRSAGTRGAKITGYLGTLSFDWYTDAISIIEHHGKAVENFKVTVAEGHHGGDWGLAKNFVKVMRGEEKSRTPLNDGLLSAAMCLAARCSEESRRIEEVRYRKGTIDPRPLTPTLSQRERE